MEIVRDLLDKQVLDRRGERMGKVDGVILELREGEPPRVAAIEVGLVTAVRRLHMRWLDRWARRVAEPVRIPMGLVTEIGHEVKVDLDAERTDATRVERWLRDHVVARIPGGK